MTHPSQRPGDATVSRRNPTTMWDSTANGHSQISVAEAGRLAFLSGQIAAAADDSPTPTDLVGQARMVAANLAAALAELGASARDIVLLRLYVVDGTTERFREASSTIRELLLDGELPSITAIGVQALFTPAFQLEVEMVVRVP